MRKRPKRTIEEFESYLHHALCAFWEVPPRERAKAMRRMATKIIRQCDRQHEEMVRHKSRLDPVASGC